MLDIKEYTVSSHIVRGILIKRFLKKNFYLEVFDQNI
jgi:hypothetical protein